MLSEADYIVVGGGSAGAVVASRLSEDSKATVVLLEAGGTADSFMVRLPAGFARMLNDPRYDWCYQQDADPSIQNRHFVWSAGKMLGGSSSINGQVYIRGAEIDHARWVQDGCTGWSFSECLPYFIRSERFSGDSSSCHGTQGPLSVIRIPDPHPLAHTFMQACAQKDIPSLNDYCDGNMDGSFLTLCTQFPNATRCSTAHAHLREARGRRNLQVLTHASVEQILFENRRAVGVRARINGEAKAFKARREIIVCASAVGSPALLMRSGIGPGRDLQSLGIPVVLDCTAVGDNLQEHAAVPINKFVNVPTYSSQMGRWHLMRHAFQYFFQKKGPMATPAVQAMALARTQSDLEHPDVQLHFLPLSYDIDPETTSASSGHMDTRDTVMISASTCRPHTRGRIKLRSARAEDAPQIAHQLLSDRRDVDTLVQACKLIESIFDAPAWRAVVTGPRSPSKIPTRDAEWEPFVRSHATIAYHPVGTCRMGSDPGSVVDPQLRVRGVTGLRVADASVIPTTTSANTNATAIMIGERAADFVRAQG